MENNISNCIAALLGKRLEYARYSWQYEVKKTFTVRSVTQDPGNKNLAIINKDTDHLRVRWKCVQEVACTGQCVGYEDPSDRALWFLTRLND